MTNGQTGNLYADAHAPPTGERFDSLLDLGQVKIERIVSSALPEPEVYQQEQDEWVVLLRGQADLYLADQTLTLTEGDYVFIPRGAPHRVTRTAPGTVWLAVHVHSAVGAVVDRTE